ADHGRREHGVPALRGAGNARDARARADGLVRPVARERVGAVGLAAIRLRGVDRLADDVGPELRLEHDGELDLAGGGAGLVVDVDLHHDITAPAWTSCSRT